VQEEEEEEEEAEEEEELINKEEDALTDDTRSEFEELLLDATIVVLPVPVLIGDTERGKILFEMLVLAVALRVWSSWELGRTVICWGFAMCLNSSEELSRK
jgi:hypothetical protein